MPQNKSVPEVPVAKFYIRVWKKSKRLLIVNTTYLPKKRIIYDQHNNFCEIYYCLIGDRVGVFSDIWLYYSVIL